MPEKVYARGESKSSFESMTKEEIVAAITNAIQSGTIGDIDAGFITRLKEINHGETLRFWVGTSAEFNALTQREENVLYIKTDDTSRQDIESAIAELNTEYEAQNAQLAAQNQRITTAETNISNLQTAVGNVIKMRQQVVFPALAAGETREVKIQVPSEISSFIGTQGVVSVTRNLTSLDNETYNPNLHIYGYIYYDEDFNYKLVVGAHNSGDSASDTTEVWAAVF